MEDASVAHCHESSSEDNHRPGNGILLDIVNGCRLAHTAVSSDHIQLDEHVKSEDLLNNNKASSEQDSLTNQRFVCSGDCTAAGDQISAADNPKETFLTSSKDGNRAEYKETFNHSHDSCQTTDKDGRERCNAQSKGALSNYTLKNNIGKDISGSHEISQGDLQNEELKKEMHNPCKGDLLKLQENLDEEESLPSESSSGDRPKECLEINHFVETAESDSDPSKRDFLDDKSTIVDCDTLIHAENNVNNHAVHIKTSKCDIRSTKQIATSNMEHCDVLANAASEGEDGTKNCSLDFQSKRFGLCLPKKDGTRRGKRKKEHRSLKCGRLQPVLHELEFVEEEDLSEKEESSEEDNMDNSFHYSCSKDGLDHRKERHQYVSDKLDPDVLHLLEMHLRKQQLVDIKEEGEEEMIDVHINKEMSRSDSYKLLRNIPPVLDMVLEEPELEHAGDLLEEDSKTPSDVDSDDSSNVYSMEIGLMESLQYDLMSKSSKIDKHEIATILQEPSPDFLSKGNKRKYKEDASCRSEGKSKSGNVRNKEPKEHEVQMEDPSKLQIIHKLGAEDVESDIDSEDVGSGNVSEDVGQELVSEDAGPDFVSEDVGSDLVSEDVGSDLVSEDVGPDLVSEDVGPDLVSEDVGPDLVSEDVGSDLVSEDVGSDLVSEDVESDLVSEDVGPDLVSEDVGPDLFSEDVGSGNISEDVGSSLVSEDVGSSLVSEDVGSGIASEDVGSGIASEDRDDTVEDIINASLQAESYFSDPLKGVSEQPLAINDPETIKTPVIKNAGITEPFQADQSSDLAPLDHSSDVTQLEVSKPVTEVEETKLHDSSALNGSKNTLRDSTKAGNASGSPCPTFDGKGGLHLESRIPSDKTDGLYPCDEGDFRRKNDSSKLHDDRVLTKHQITLTDVNQDLKDIQANVKSPTESSHSEAPLYVTSDMNTLHEDLKPKILSLLEKAHAADCRSSHLQAEAELLFKESIELRNECKSLSKEAAELLSILTQHEVLHRHQMRQSPQDAEAEGLRTTTSKPTAKETLSFGSKRTSKKKKAESQLQILSKKYSFLRQEAPEIIRELHVLQQDLKNVTPHHSKPISLLYKWLCGGLIAGGAMLLVWWSTKQLG